MSKARELREQLDAAIAEETNAVALARRFVAEHASHAGDPLIRKWRGDWYTWDATSGCYNKRSDDTIDSRLYRVLGLSSRKIVADVRHAMIAVGGVLIDEAELGSWLGDPLFDADPRDIAAAPNGLIDLRSGVLVPASPRYFSTSALGVRYEPTAPEPTQWLEFLRQVWPEDDGDERRALLQEWWGLTLSPDTRMQKILMLVGRPRCGKGTIARVHTALLGRASVVSPTLASLGTNFGLQPLIGKTAAIIGDARLNGRSDVVQIMERLLGISGDDCQTIDRKNREAWIGYLSTRIMILCNELPRFADASGALAHRFLPLTLHQSWLGREDQRLTDKLTAELPGILNWAIAGWQRLRERGRFALPESSRRTTDELADLASPVVAWTRDACVVDPDLAVPCDRAYASFRTWCVHNGHDHVPTVQTFGRDLQAAGHDRKQRRLEGRPVWHYLGLTLGGSPSPAVTSVTGSI